MWYFVLFPGKSDAAIHVLFPLSVRGRYVTLFTVLCAHYSLHFILSIALSWDIL